jgi:hypothetical protein
MEKRVKEEGRGSQHAFSNNEELVATNGERLTNDHF